MNRKYEYAELIANEDLRRSLAHVKRFLERFMGDGEFRSAILAEQLSLADAADRCGCKVNLDTLLPVFHPDYVHLRKTATEAEWPLTYYWNHFILAKLEFKNTLLELGDSGGMTPQYDLWRQRNISRAKFELGSASGGIVHAPVAFELSSGCSVGCPFCGISARPFRGHFSLRGEGAAEWRRTVLGMQSVLGRALRMGFCYWATDPLDNPDYPGFIEIFSEIADFIPQTTTAIPLRNLELTKRVLAMWNPAQLVPNRFSVLTTGILRRIHETFTPEELLGVELVLQNRGSIEVTKFRAGKNIERSEKRSGEQPEREGTMNGTIACVSGFLVNIVEKTIRLVSPTMPSTEWPDGYIVFDQASYATPDEIEGILRTLVARHMSTELNPAAVATFARGIRYSREGEEAWIRSNAIEVSHPDWRNVGELLEKGQLTPVQMVETLCRRGENPFKTVDTINRLWRAGLVVSKAPVM